MKWRIAEINKAEQKQKKTKWNRGMIDNENEKETFSDLLSVCVFCDESAFFEWSKNRWT